MELYKNKGVYPSHIKYGEGFGITVWFVNDLDEIPAAQNWPIEERLRFMEMYGDKIGDVTEDDSVMNELRTQKRSMRK